MIDFTQKFLILTAHPDDLEMSCAGTVKKINAKGGSVTNLIMVRPNVDVRPNRSKDKVLDELKNSSKILGQKVDIHDTQIFENGRPNLQLTNNLITKLENKFKNFDVIISHWHEDYHQDHRTCFNIAQILARKNFKQFLCFDQPTYNRFYSNFNKNMYVDITDYVDDKRQALMCYDTYFTDADIDAILAYNKYNGSFLGPNKFAETFNMRYSKI